MSSSGYAGILSGLLLLGLTGCREIPPAGNSSSPVARVYDKYLYREDLPEMGHLGASNGDSIEITGEFINEWIRNTLLLHHAEVRFNGTPVLEDINRQTSEYRSALLLYAFKQEITRHSIDTLVSEQALKEFTGAGNRVHGFSDSVASREDTLYLKHLFLNERRNEKINAAINRYQEEALGKNAIEIF